jgi:penicillin-binding protein 1A
MFAPRLRKHTRFVFWTTYGLLVLAAIAAGGLVGLLFGYAVDLPRVSELQLNRPALVSYVYSSDGRIIGQFAQEKRILVTYEQIPERMKQAVLAAEDANFFEHPGIDVLAIARTAFWDLIHWERKGGSTLTMQLSKLRFTSAEKTLERKIKDALYAIDIEKNYSKEQIFTFYANQIPMGHGRYGLAAGADFYFHKTLAELSTAECATLAEVIQVPVRLSPITHPKRALARRNWVLGRMHELGFIDQSEYQTALTEPMDVKGRDDDQSPAPYFVEWVRQYLETQYPTRDIWQGGLRIYTTLDYDMQMAADRAIKQGLRDFDRKKRGWAGPVDNILKRGLDPEKYRHPDWARLFYEGQMIHGLVLDSNPDSATVRFGSYTAAVTPEDIAWTKHKKVNDVLSPGDIDVFTLEKVDRESKTIHAELDQIPEVQGAALILDNRSGAVRAMVGGFDFNLSKFNRATQALRQPGSVFKPFTYVAAMEAGFSPEDPVLDSPVEFTDALGRPYAPTNWDDEFKGLITIRQALAESRNVPTVRLANTLGPQKIADVAKRFGLKQDFPPYLSIALGSVEVTLSEMVSAFSAFPNHGVRAQPYYVDRVEDHNGSILEEHRAQVFDAVVSPDVADKMLYLLREVVRSGSGRLLLDLGRPIGGKTGTTNESTDTWFVGFTPRLAAGVWVGYDEKKSLGEKVYGNTLALPIWKDMMKEALKEVPPSDFESTWQPTGVSMASEEQREELLEPQPGTTETPPAEQPAKKEPPRKVFTVEDIKPPPPSQ